MAGNSAAGTWIKFNLHVEPVDGHHLADSDWHAEAHTDRPNGKRLRIEKKDARKIDADNYLLVVNAAIPGPGEYFITLYARIPDSD